MLQSSLHYTNISFPFFAIQHGEAGVQTYSPPSLVENKYILLCSCVSRGLKQGVFIHHSCSSALQNINSYFAYFGYTWTFICKIFSVNPMYMFEPPNNLHGGEPNPKEKIFGSTRLYIPDVVPTVPPSIYDKTLKATVTYLTYMYLLY